MFFAGEYTIILWSVWSSVVVSMDCGAGQRTVRNWTVVSVELDCGQ